MPNPQPTLDPRELIGPIQQYPWEGAQVESYDINIDACWCVNERTQVLEYLSDPQKFQKHYLGGVRVVFHKRMIYIALAMDFDKQDSDIDNAFDRAMSIVGKI